MLSLKHGFKIKMQIWHKFYKGLAIPCQRVNDIKEESVLCLDTMKIGVYCKRLQNKCVAIYRVNILQHKDNKVLVEKTIEDTLIYSKDKWNKFKIMLNEFVSFDFQDSQAGVVLDMSTSLVDLSDSEIVAYIETISWESRLLQLYPKLFAKLQTVQIQQDTMEDMKKELKTYQDKSIIQKQIQVLQNKLGNDSPFDKQLELLKPLLLPKVFEAIEKQVSKLKSTPQASPEYAMTEQWLQFVFQLPWALDPLEKEQIQDLRKLLDKDHFGLIKPKDHIMDYMNTMTVASRNNKVLNQPILCFVGPPGTGKTSLAISIANALQLPYERISLGGVNDVATIRGHRRTYIGAHSGNILSALVKTKTKHSLLILDEIDKVGKDYRGDPSSALLELLDPHQNHSFYDNYLGLPFDLSNVMFITTANDIHNISLPLRDRMEIIHVPMYTKNEKIQIAKRHLIPNLMSQIGLKEDQIVFKDEVILYVISNYTAEAGVRQLDQRLKRLIYHYSQSSHISVKIDKIGGVLGPPYNKDTSIQPLSVGVALGLSWSTVGGDVLFIECVKYPGKGRIKLTGNLGKVIQESAELAFAWIRANRQEDDSLVKFDYHIHFPSGASQKDGPSAGIAILSAMLSCITNKPLPRIAMTGELSLRGDVLPIGGLKEKSLGALEYGIYKVIIPKRNQQDLEDIDTDSRKRIKFYAVSTAQQALDILFKSAKL